MIDGEGEWAGSVLGTECMIWEVLRSHPRSKLFFVSEIADHDVDNAFYLYKI